MDGYAGTCAVRISSSALLPELLEAILPKYFIECKEMVHYTLIEGKPGRDGFVRATGDVIPMQTVGAMLATFPAGCIVVAKRPQVTHTSAAHTAAAGGFTAPAPAALQTTVATAAVGGTRASSSAFTPAAGGVTTAAPAALNSTTAAAAVGGAGASSCVTDTATSSPLVACRPFDYSSLEGIDDATRWMLEADRRSYDPLSDVTSIGSGSSVFTRFSSDTATEFKLAVVDFYGLANPVTSSYPFDMLGNSNHISEVTLAHFIPRCYGNQMPPEALGLSVDALADERCYLLLPRDVRTWFDNGVIGFVPTRTGIVLRVFNAGHPKYGAAASTSGLDGKALHIPLAVEGKWPFKRVLGWFAWIAKVRFVGLAEAAADAGLDASADASGVLQAKRLRNAAMDVAARLGLMMP